MQPARQDLPIVPGTTYRDTVRLMQPEFVYRPVAGISGAPVRLSVEDHGLASDWPVWVRGVQGMPSINREPPNQLPWRARRIDEDTLEINQLSAAVLNPVGGELVYKLPVDLSGASVAMTFTGGEGAPLVLTLGNGLASPAPGTITRELTPSQTATLVGKVTYTMDVTFADGTVTRYYEGGIARPGGCHG